MVLELGCGSGALTRHLVAAGHRVVATDTSPPAMPALAREAVPGVEAFRRLALPDEQLPPADAVVSVGHVLSYLPNALWRFVADVLAREPETPCGERFSYSNVGYTIAGHISPRRLPANPTSPCCASTCSFR